MDEPESCRVLYIDWSKRCLDRVEILRDDPVVATNPKHDLFARLYASNERVAISFITTGLPDLKLPDAIRSMGAAKLRWGQMFDIPEFGYDAGGVFGTITIRSAQSFVYVPWAAIYEISTDSGLGPYKWPDDSK